MKSCMVILNTTSLIYDARVRKEGRVLVDAGYKVNIVGLRQHGEHVPVYLDDCSLSLFELISRRLPRTPLSWPVKYCEFVIKSLVRLIRYKADVYHAHDLDALIPAWLAARITGNVVVYDSHELFTERPIEMPWMWRAIERYLIGRVDAVIAASDERAEIMFHEYGAKKLPHVIINCPSQITKPSLRSLRDELPKSIQEKFLVVYQGGFSPERCLESLVLAVRCFDERAVLVFLGNPTAFSEKVLKPLIKENGLETRIHFLKAVDPNELVSFISSADIGVVIYKNVSRNNYYCAPNKLFDYCMAGLPVVGCDFPSVQRFAYNYGIARLFDPDNPQSIANEVNNFLTDRVAYDLAKKQTKYVVNNYNWENEAGKLIKLYLELFPKRSGLAND